MKKTLLIVVCVCGSAICVPAQSVNDQPGTAPTQQTASPTNPNAGKMTNADVLALAGLGLSDDIVVAKIYDARTTDFDTSVAGLTALKTAKISDDVVRVMLNPHKPTTELNAQTPPAPDSSPQQGANNKPRVFFQSTSSGNTWNANRNQSMGMSKDFEKDCPAVQISIAQQFADYTVALNHIELGLLVRDNQIQVADKNGDLISKSKEGGSIRGGMKKVCDLILADWAKKAK